MSIDDMVPIIPMQPLTAQQAVSEIWFMSGIPWDNTYNHVRMYGSRGDLDDFLKSKRKHVIRTSAPVRIGNLDIDVPYNEMVSYNINYVRFINAPYDDTPHYAFVTDIQWLSVNSTRLSIEMDIWQECEFTMTLNKCFVHKTHVSVADDIPGRYTYPEGLETGEQVFAYTSDGLHQIPPRDESRTRAIVFATTFDEDGNVAEFGTWQGTYSGLHYTVFELDVPSDIKRVNKWLQDIYSKNLQEGIVNAVIVPTSFTNGYYDESIISWEKPYEKFGEYKPKCKKCFVYPYKYLLATDNMGTTVEYRFEEFFVSDTDWTQSAEVTFIYSVSTGAEPTLVVYPQYYKRVQKNYTDCITFSNYSKVALSTDTYKAWLAQNSALLKAGAINTALDAGGGIVNSIVGSLSSPNILGGIGTFLSGVTSTVKNTAQSAIDMMAQVESHKVVAPGSTGVQSNVLACAADFDHIAIYTVECTEEYIGKIDSIFWAYGYTINDIMHLNIIKSRKYWNYIQTVGCNITGAFPLDYQSKLRAIFDKGVTIWHTDDMYNYDLNNNMPV